MLGWDVGGASGGEGLGVTWERGDRPPWLGSLSGFSHC